MNDLIKEIIDKTTKITEIISEYDSLNDLLKLYTNGTTSKLFEENYSFIKPYLDDPKLIDAFDPSNFSSTEKYVEILSTVSYLFPKSFTYKIIEKYKSKDNNIINYIFIMSKEDIDFLLSIGYTDKEIISQEGYIADTSTTKYLLSISTSEDFYDYLKENQLDKCPFIVIDELKKNNTNILKNYFSYYSYEDNIIRLFDLLTEEDIPNLDEVIDRIILLIDNHSEISIIKDKELANKLIDKIGSKILVFIDNPDEEIISKINDFKLEDYIRIDGSYKDSTPLLKYFIERGEIDAIKYTSPNAITDEIINILLSKNIDIKQYQGYLFSPNPIDKSLAFNKYLVSQGDYSNIQNLENIYSDLEIFNFVFKCSKETNLKSSELSIINLLAGKEVEDKSLPSSTISPEVSKRMIELGLSFDKYLELSGSSESLLKEYYSNGENKALILMRDIEENDLSKITYENYLEVLNIKPDLTIHHEVALKLIKDGHYDVIKHVYEYSLNSIIRELKLEELSDEEYYKLPKELQELTILKDKHVLPTIDEIRTRLSEKVDEENISLAAKVNMPYEEIIEYINNNRYYKSIIPKELLIKYLNEGHIDVLKYAADRFNSDYDDALEVYYNLVEGKIPSQEEFDSYSSGIKSSLFNIYLKHKKYEIVKLNNNQIYSYSNNLNVLKDNNYSIDDFINNPIFDGDLINTFINEDNIDRVTDIVTKNNNKINNGNNLLINLYRSNIPASKTIKIAKLCKIDIQRLLLDISKDEMSIIELIDIEEALQDPKTISLIIDKLDPTQVEKLLQSKAYMSEKVTTAVIDGMVSKDNYQFIKYYQSSGSERSLKKSVLNGYIPSPSEIRNSYYLSRKLYSITLNEEEHTKVKTYLETNPRYILYCLDDYKDDKEAIYEKVLEEPELIDLLPEEYQKDIDLLERIATTRPYIASNYYPYLEKEDKTRLLEANPEIIKYINTYSIDVETIEKVVEKQPEIIDYIDYPSDKAISIAFENGYKLNEKSNKVLIKYALNNNKEIPIDIWNKDNIYNLLNNINTDNYNSNKEVIDTIFDKLYESEKEEFIIILTSYNSYNVYQIILNTLNKYGYSAEEYNTLSNTNDLEKRRFILKLKELEKLSEEEQIKTIIEYLETSEYKKECCDWLVNHNQDSYLQSYIKTNYEKDPLIYAKYINEADEEIINITKKLILEDPEKYHSLNSYIPQVLDSKEVILKIIKYDPYVYNAIKEEYRLDYDIAHEYILIDYYYISSISPNTEKYEDLCIEAITKDGRSYRYIPVLSTSESALILAVKTYPNAIINADKSIVTDEVLNNISDLTTLSLEKLDISIIIKIINQDRVDTSNKELLDRLLSIINQHSNEITIDNKISQLIINLSREDPDLVYKKYFNLFLLIDNSYLSEEEQKVKENAKSLLKAYGKVNTLEKNPVFSYELVKYAYPSVGEASTVDLMRYNSGADKEIINIIKDGKKDIANAYFSLVQKYHIFEDDDKLVHFAFRYFSRYSELIENIINEELTQEEIINLTKVIMNKNLYKITTKEELTHYDEVLANYAEKMLVSTDTKELKNFLANTFGYSDIDSLKVFFENHRLDNFAQIYDVLKELEQSIGIENTKDLRFTVEETKIILLMKEIIETDNIDELHQLIKNNLDQKNNIFDYSDIVNSINLKVRKLYNTEFNSRLSKVKDLKSKKTTESSTITNYLGEKQDVEYELIDMDEEPFNFLVHRIYHYDSSMNSFFQMIIKDPSLWTKLDGASTLSTSSISDKGFWMLNALDPTGIIYIFDTLPDEFMLFMYGRDLYVEHGGHKLEPTSNSNCYMDLDSLNQATATNHHSSYNEVAGFRRGVMPSAILCNGPHPTEAQIRAAAYFNIPIIRFDINKYNEICRQRYEDTKTRLKDKSTIEDIYNIIYNGQRGVKLDDSIDYCLDSIRNSYLSKKIDYMEMINQLVELRKLVNKVSEKDNHKQVRKIEILIQTIAIERNLSEEELIDIEEANMGESGIMYKQHIGEKTYLLKPSVDKQQFSKQPFRAEIQKAAYKLQSIISPDTAVEVDVQGDRNLRISKQEKLELDSNPNLLETWINTGGELDSKYKRQLLQEYVVDFLICNFDSFAGNFILDSNNNIRGVDKEQSFRFIDNEESLKPDFSYIPNGLSRIPIYKILFERYNEGEIDLDFTVVDEKIKILEEMPDTEYKEIFRKYAESLNKNNSEILLDKILERKRKCIENMKKYINEIRKDKTKEGETL